MSIQKRRARGGGGAAGGGGGAAGGGGGEDIKQGGAVRFRTSFHNTILDVMRDRGWKETDSEASWDVLWGDREWVYEIFDTMRLENQRVNHFRNGRELCRKDLLVKNLKRKKRALERESKPEEAENYDFSPVTFVLPREYAMFVEEFKAHGGVYIMKPIGSAQGKGIFLFTKLSEISEWRTDYKYARGEEDKAKKDDAEAYVVQRYISNPYLIGGKKFDLRIYVLVTNFSPLQVWFHRSGFARFSHTRYSSDPRDIANNFMHLTNVAIQKTAENYEARSGGKWDIRSLKLYMVGQFGREMVDELFWRMQMMVLRSLFAVQQVMINDRHCFELYGYDIMIDDALKPWLIEVNASPSLTANTREDYDLKSDMLHDLFDVMDLEGNLKGDEEHVGGFDLIYDNGYVEMPQQDSCWSSYLGAAIPPPGTTHARSGATGRTASRPHASSSSNGEAAADSIEAARGEAGEGDKTERISRRRPGSSSKKRSSRNQAPSSGV